MIVNHIILFINILLIESTIIALPKKITYARSGFPYNGCIIQITKKILASSHYLIVESSDQFFLVKGLWSIYHTSSFKLRAFFSIFKAFNNPSFIRVAGHIISHKRLYLLCQANVHRRCKHTRQSGLKLKCHENKRYFYSDNI